MTNSLLRLGRGTKCRKCRHRPIGIHNYVFIFTCDITLHLYDLIKQFNFGDILDY